MSEMTMAVIVVSASCHHLTRADSGWSRISWFSRVTLPWLRGGTSVAPWRHKSSHVPVFRRLFDRLPVRISTSDLHHRILRKKPYDIRAYDFGVQFSFNCRMWLLYEIFFLSTCMIRLCELSLASTKLPRRNGEREREGGGGGGGREREREWAIVVQCFSKKKKKSSPICQTNLKFDSGVLKMWSACGLEFHHMQISKWQNSNVFKNMLLYTVASKVF